MGANTKPPKMNGNKHKSQQINGSKHKTQQINGANKTIEANTKPQTRIKFRQLRNETNTMIRNSKQQFYDNIAEKLKSKSLSSKDWWSTLKTFISPNLNSAIPPIESERIIYTDDFEKANLFNNYFQGQTILDDSNAVLPALPEPSYLTSLSSIAFDPQEVEEILKTLKTDKASGPDGLSNRILKELSHELSSPLCSLFNKSLSLGKFPSPYKDANVTLYIRKVTCLLFLIIGLYLR